MNAICFWLTIILLASGGVMPPAQAQFSNPSSTLLSATTIPVSEQMQTSELAGLLKQKNAERPLLLQVGSHVMYLQAHIPDSKYAGPGSDASGLELLQKVVTGVPKDKQIVIYCGCCPWNRCPNMGPAYKRLRDLGFRNVKALYMAKNFGEDWVVKGYPVEKGE